MRCLNVLIALVLLLAIGIQYLYIYQTVLFNPPLDYLQLIGGVTNTSVIVWVRSTNSSHFSVQYRTQNVENSNETFVWAKENIYFSEENDFIEFIKLTNLSSNTKYEYQIILYTNKTNNPIISTTIETFTTFPSQEDKRENTEVIFGSCMSRTFYPFDELKVFEFIQENLNPNFALILGDLVYTDIDPFLPYRLPFSMAYRQILSDDHYQRFIKKVPVFAMLDDHEIENDYDRGYRDPLAVSALHFYQLYYGFRNPTISSSLPMNDIDNDNDNVIDIENETQIYYSFEYGDFISVFVLDTRLNRSPFAQNDDKYKTMLGIRQKEKLFDWLIAPNKGHNSIKIIASPISWSTVGDGEFYQHERSEIFSFIENNNICNVIILSGDLHWAAAYKYSDHLYEFTASPFQALPFPAPSLHHQHHSSRWRRGYDDVFHFNQEKLFFSSFRFHFGHLKRDFDNELVVISLYSYPILGKIFQTKPSIDFEFTFRFDNQCLVAS